MLLGVILDDVVSHHPEDEDHLIDRAMYVAAEDVSEDRLASQPNHRFRLLVDLWIQLRPLTCCRDDSPQPLYRTIEL